MGRTTELMNIGVNICLQVLPLRWTVLHIYSTRNLGEEFHCITPPNIQNASYHYKTSLYTFYVYPYYLARHVENTGIPRFENDQIIFSKLSSDKQCSPKRWLHLELMCGKGWAPRTNPRSALVNTERNHLKTQNAALMLPRRYQRMSDQKTQEPALGDVDHRSWCILCR